MQTYTVLKVHPEDSVAVAIRPLSQGRWWRLQAFR
jgi:altronate hydrolase